MADVDKWRILIFMSTESEGLVEAAKADVTELLSCADTSGLAIRLQVHGYLLDRPGAKGVARYTIASAALKRDVDPVTAPQPADTSAFADFLTWGLGDVAAETARAIVFWGHAQGVGDSILPPGGPPPPPSGGGRGLAGRVVVSPGRVHVESRPSPDEMKNAIFGAHQGKQQARRPDLFVFDSCFMASAEIAAHFGDAVSYLLASQTSVARPALDFTELLRSAKRIEPSKVTEPGRALGMALLDQANASAKFVRSLSLFKPGVAMPDQNAFVKAMKAFVDELKVAMSAPKRAARVHEIMLGVASYGIRQFLDLPEMARRLADADHVLNPTADALGKVLDATDDGFLVARRPEPKHGGPHGVSIYCPWIRPTRAEIDDGVLDVVVLEDDYRKFEFAQKSGWFGFAYGLAETWAAAQNRCEAAETNPCACDSGCPRPQGPGLREAKPHDLSYDPDAKPHDLARDTIGAEFLPSPGAARRRH